MVSDPRIAPVEDNLLVFYRDVLSAPILTVAELDGARGYYTDIPFPLCNVVFDARFDPDRAAEQTRAVLEDYIARGLPFLWWATPSTTSPELERVCAEAGMVREDVPGMHRPLDGPVEVRLPERLDIRVTTEDQLEVLTHTVLDGFDMPAFLLEPLQEFYRGLDETKLVNVLASLDGQPVACGSTYITGTTAGVYNIATLEAFRGRGIGYAVTAWLMNHAHERGCTETILHASPDGLPVYERLGYETVCTLPQMVWVPSA